jgi:hypothetical protein
MYIPKALAAILLISLAFIFTYCRYKSVPLRLIYLQILHYTKPEKAFLTFNLRAGIAEWYSAGIRTG